MTRVSKTGCPSLISLSSEVLCQVLLHLDDSSILAAKQTSRALYFASKSRQLWYRIIIRLQMSQGVPAPEEEMDAYTVEELEKWAFRRNRAQDLWAGISKCRFSNRLLRVRAELPSPAPSYCKLIPGGRWLLVGYSDARMCTVDLEDAKFPLYPVYNPGEFDKKLCGQTLEVTKTFWVDQSKPQLSLRIAGCVAEYSDSDPETLTDRRTFVYHVDLVGHGSAATLVAKPYALFANPGLGDRNYNFGLNERYVVDHWMVDNGDEFVRTGQLRVYDYSANVVNGTSQSHLTYSATNPIVYDLKSSLCHGINFVYGNTFIVIGTLPDAVYVLEVDPETRSIMLLHIIETSCRICSDVVRFPGLSESRMVLVGSNPIVLGIVIPHHKNVPVTTVKLAEVNYTWTRQRSLTALGTSVSLFFQLEFYRSFSLNIFWILNQSWDILQPSRQVGNVFDTSMDTNSELASFDQSIGRLVYRPYRGDDLSIIDLV